MLPCKYVSPGRVGTQQNGTQDHSFYGTQSTISGSGGRTVNTFVVEAWTARTDLGDSTRAQLLARSPELTCRLRQSDIRTF